MSLKTENILVVPTASFDPTYLHNMFNVVETTDLINILHFHTYHPRNIMEEDPSYKQIIPYVVVINENNEVLTYQRSTKGGEDRLHNMYSIGIGGHIDQQNKKMTGFEAYIDSLVRETQEELNINTSRADYTIKGTIYHEKDEVSKVHFGVVSILRVHSREFEHDGELDVLINREFLPIEKLEESIDQLEYWSQILINNKDILFEGCQ